MEAHFPGRAAGLSLRQPQAQQSWQLGDNGIGAGKRFLRPIGLVFITRAFVWSALFPRYSWAGPNIPATGLAGL